MSAILPHPAEVDGPTCSARPRRATAPREGLDARPQAEREEDDEDDKTSRPLGRRGIVER
jgi:hypothetical protein